MITILFAGPEKDWPVYKDLIPAAVAARGIRATMVQECAPEQVDYIVFSPKGPISDFNPFINLKAVLSLWAGVEKIEANKTLRVPLCRMVDDGLQQGMVEWVTGHVLRHHLGIDAQILNQNGTWDRLVPPLAKNRKVGILGLGALGAACAKMLAVLNFDVAGWSRRQKDLAGITCYSGGTGLDEILKRSEILILLLPQTPETHHILNAKTLAQMPKGAVIVNPGRGPLIDDNALLAALDTGQIGHATLDVFKQEPLPPEHPYWAHESVTVTPHIASETRPDTAAEIIATNVERGEKGADFLFLVDRQYGY